MTLTTNPVSVLDCDDWNERFQVIQNSWRLLHKRIVKKYGKFDYLSVRVAEGYGVIHILYRGVKIPDSWLRSAWNEIHGSHIIDNRPTRGGDRGASWYLASQYFGGQQGALMYGYSRDWIYPGASKEYVKIKRTCKDYSNGYVNKYGILCGHNNPEEIYKAWKWLLNAKYEAGLFGDDPDEALRRYKINRLLPHNVDGGLKDVEQ